MSGKGNARWGAHRRSILGLLLNEKRVEGVHRAGVKEVGCVNPGTTHLHSNHLGLLVNVQHPAPDWPCQLLTRRARGVGGCQAVQGQSQCSQHRQNESSSGKVSGRVPGRFDAQGYVGQV